MPNSDAPTRALSFARRLGSARSRALLSAAFAGLLVLRAVFGAPTWLEVVVACAYGVALPWAMVRRARPRSGPGLPSVGQLDLELSTLAVVPCLLLATDLGSPMAAFSLGFAVLGMVLLAGFCSPWATALSCTLLGLSFALVHVALPELPVLPSLVTLGLLGVAALGTRMAVGQLESRYRARVRDHARRERTGMRSAARAYGLTPDRPAAEGGDPASDDLRLQSSLDEIRDSLSASLSLCRRALGATSVALLGLETDARTLQLRAASTTGPRISQGPFDSGEGVFGAALNDSAPLELVGPQAIRSLPYYETPGAVGHVVALPLRERGLARGLLVMDRERARPLSPPELETLNETARLVQRTVANERALIQLEEAKREQSKLYRAVERLNEANSEAAVIQAGVGSAREFAAFHFAAVTLLRSDGIQEICGVSGEGAEQLAGQTFQDSHGLVGMVTDSRQVLPYRGECEAGAQVVFSPKLDTPELASLLVLPLLVRKEVLGTLVLGSSETGAFGSAERMTLQVLARHVAVSLANARMVKRLEELATTDGLTGLLNKRSLIEVAQQKLLSAQRFSKSLSLLICDLDHFKRVNDTYGHDVGDRVIAGFARVLSRSKRETDAVGRFGGEEFVVVCEETDEAGARLLAERVRSELAATSFVTAKGTLRVTASIGAATCPLAPSDWDELFKAADEALYVAKRSGRDRVVAWSARRASQAAS